MKNVFAVTINFNNAQSTNKLIKSLRSARKKYFDLKIIVVDNSTDEKFSPEKDSDNLQVITPERNTGFSGGSNIGIRNALEEGADYVLLINNDTVIDANLIENLLKVLQDEDQAGAVCPKIYFEKGKEFHKDRYEKNDLGKVLWYAGGFIDWENVNSVHRGVDEVDSGKYDKMEKIDFATGCCMLIKREVLENVGLFDESYFLYYEDADLSVRIKKAGFEIYYIPDAFMYHENASSSGSGSPLHDYFLTRNQMIFGMKYAPMRAKLALMKQSFNFLLKGREYQKRGIRDYYQRKFGKGTYFSSNKLQHLTTL